MTHSLSLVSNIDEVSTLIPKAYFFELHLITTDENAREMEIEHQRCDKDKP